MKKFLFTLLTLSIVLACAFVPTIKQVRCEEVPALSASVSSLSATALENRTSYICKHIPRRTSFVDECQSAAEALAALFTEDGLISSVQSFTRVRQVRSFFEIATEEYTSYNVVAETVPVEGRKTILITAPFANHYSDNPSYKGTGAEGALGTATSTALVLELARFYAQNVETNVYNYKFALFSGTDEGNFGSESYVDETANSLDDVILVINLERLGGGDIFYYTDEAATSHGKFIDELASSYPIKPFPLTGRVMLEASTVEGLGYAHYAMLGDNATFMSEGKACLEFIGGSFNGLGSGDGKGNATNTQYDTYDHLNDVYPDYAEKLITVGNFIVDLTARSELAGVCNGSAQSYKIFTKSWVAYAIGIGIILILILILLAVTRTLDRKYPIPKQPKVKLAVFGSEFEDAKDDEIIVDIKQEGKNDDGDPFDI